MEDKIEDIDHNLVPIAEADELIEEQEASIPNSLPFNSKYLYGLNQAIQDCSTKAEDLLETLARSFENLQTLINSVPNSHVSKEVASLAKCIHLKAQDIEPDESKREVLNRRVWQTTLSSLSGVNEERLAINAGYTLLKLLDSMINKDSYFNEELSTIVLSSLQALASSELIQIKKSRKWYEKLKSLKEFKIEDFLTFLKAYNKPIKYMFLQYAFETTGDKEIQGLLLDKFRDLVLNDKEKQNQNNFKYFVPFLNNVEPDIFKAEVFTHMEFMMKRNGQLLTLIAATFRQIHKVPIDHDLLKALTSDMLTTEFLVGDDYYQPTQELISNVASKLDSPDLIPVLIIDFLLKQFASSKQSSFNISQRQRIFKQIRSAIKNLPIPFINDKLIQPISQVIVDHLFQTKEEQVIREVFDDAIAIMEHNQSLQYLNESLKVLVPKTTHLWQISLLTNLILRNKQISLNNSLEIVTPKFKQLLTNENYGSTVNYSQILALGAFFAVAYSHTHESVYIQTLLENESFMNYITNDKGHVNSLSYFKKSPSIHDTTDHLQIIKVLLSHHQSEQSSKYSDFQLRDTLFEYFLNDSYIFRESIVFTCLEDLSKSFKDSIIPGFLKSLFNKIKQIDSRQKDDLHLPNMSLLKKVQFIFKTLLKNSQAELRKDEVLTILKIMSHPVVSKGQKELIQVQKEVDQALKDKEKTIQSYIDLYAQDVITYALFERTGILSSNKTLRQLSTNLLVLLGVYGKLDSFIGEISKILSYKPLELISKLELLFEKEFDRISYYDLMFYSELTKDLLTVFTDKDHSLAERELTDSKSDEAKKEGDDDEEEKDEYSDPAKLMAQQLKKQASQKKQPVKKGQAPPKQTQPKPQVKSSEKKDESKQDAPISKEQRNKMDRHQIMQYLEDIKRIQGKHIDTAQEVIKRIVLTKVDPALNYLDTILFNTLTPSIKLLNYPASRFSTINYLYSLFSHDQKTPFFVVKNEIVNSIDAVSQQKLLQKNMRELQVIFQHLDEHAQFADMDKGYLQLILTLTNFVLKDLSVHLSVKEQGLKVTQDILDSNNRVQNIDLVRVTINMMKSSYNNSNLAQYLQKLLLRISKEELALILQRLFEYEPIPRTLMLQEVVRYDQPLFQPVWFITQLWILQFDDENNKLAKKLWTKNKMQLRNAMFELREEATCKNVFHYLRSKNTNIFESSIKAMVAAIELFQNRFDLIIEDLIEFYNSELTIIEGLSRQSVGANSSLLASEASKKVAQNERINRIAISEILKRSANLVQANSFKKVFEFFITKGCLDINEQVAKCSMEAAIKIIQQKGSLYAEELLKILDKQINEQSKNSEQSKNQAIIMIGFLANYLDNTSQKKLLGTFERMLEHLNTPSEFLRQSICKCISQLARFFDDKSKRTLEENFKILRESNDEKLLRGSAYAVAGIVKGLGCLNSEMLEIVQKECFSKNSDQLRKIAGLYLYETLSISLGKTFEMHLTKILPNILQCISDQKEQVRKPALAANKIIMSKFSNYAIKQVLPLFLKGLENDNWRSKLASVEALGNMAYCAPKQISSFLPQIVKGIREVLNDTHEKVHAAALQAIQNIGSVIKNPEIGDILDILVLALSNPNVYLKDALKTLLDTSFVHAIDAPSLSLLIPILDNGLMMHDNTSKKLASTLMGNICQLTLDPEDLLPYMKILMPAIKNSLFDSIPEIRASAAKALGSLSRGLGLDNSKEMLEWMRAVLHQKGLSTSERSGAAQGFAEIISVHGPKQFQESIVEVVTKSQDQDPSIRESFRGVMVFLPTSFEQFVKYLPQLLPIMIEGLSDDTEEVRKISLRNVKICIKQFGKQAPNQLVIPIMQMMFDKDFRVRQSSSILMYQLVKELENDIIKLQPKYITNQTKNDILSSMFILRYDTVEKVSIQASQIWKNIVDNQLKILKVVINDLVRLSFDIIQSDSRELQDMGLYCMRGLVEKFGEKLVNQSLDILEIYLEKATEISQILGITKTIANMTEAAPLKILNEVRSRFLSLVDSNLAHESDEIRNLSAKVFMTVFVKTFEPLYTTATLEKSIMHKLHYYVVNKKEKECDNLIKALKVMLDSEHAGVLRLNDKLLNICKIKELEQPLTIAQSKVIQCVAPIIAQTLFKRKLYQQVMEVLVNQLSIDVIDDENRINAVLLAFSELIASLPADDIISVNEQIASFYAKCKDKNRLGLYVDLISYYCSHSQKNYENYAQEYMRNILVLMNEQNDKLLEKVNNCINAIYDGLSKESQFSLVPLVKQVIQDLAVEDIHMNGIYRKKVDTLKLFEKASGVRNFVVVIQNSIMYGSIDIRIDSATCFKYLIDFSKLDAIKQDIIKICGALIRVVNDKFSCELKMQIFFAFKFILIKAGAAVKTMIPQLQTTFLKAYNDQNGTPALRRLVMENLLLLVKIAPKADPIVKDLASQLDGDKLDRESKIEVAESLAIIIRQNGKSIQLAMAEQISKILEGILITKKKEQFNDKTLVNCAVALAFLSAYSSKPEQMEALFQQFDQHVDLRLSLGVKFGILLNGASLNSEKLLKDLESYLVEQLSTASGIGELDKHPWYPYDSTTPNETSGRLVGALEIVAFISDNFVRRFSPSDDSIRKMLYRSILKAKIFERANSQETLFKESMASLLFSLASFPVALSSSGKLDEDLAEVIKQGFQFIHSFYLEFPDKKDGRPAILNLLMLNYNNFLDVDDAKQIQLLTKEKAKETVTSDVFQSVLDSDCKLLAVEQV